MAGGTIRYWAAAKAATGVAEERYDVRTLAELLSTVCDRHGAGLGALLDRCSFLVNGAPVGARPPAAVVLPEGATVEVLPPFAGGSL